jgi:hypothetical protein
LKTVHDTERDRERTRSRFLADRSMAFSFLLVVPAEEMRLKAHS